MSTPSRPARGALLASLALHGAVAGALALFLASGAVGRGLPERLLVALPFEVEAEPEAPRPAMAEPEAREPEVDSALDEELPEEEDPRVPDAPAEATPFDSRRGLIGLGAGGPLPRVGRPGRASPPVAGPPAADAPSPAPPLPAGPTRAALPLAGECAPPAYPPRERRRGAEGIALLLIRVTAHGEVASAELEESSGHPLLDAAALAAVRGWRFRPALREGVPVPDIVIQSVRFRLDAVALAREER